MKTKEEEIEEKQRGLERKENIKCCKNGKKEDTINK